MAQNSRMNTTGKNFVFAVLAAFAAAFVMTIIYSLMAIFVDATANGNFDLAAELGIVTQRFFYIFKTVGFCVVPVVFLIAFALLQRFRIKN